MSATRATPLASVIIPCYRQAQYLATAIDSALAQTYPAVEVVVVNDGSDDDTEGVAAGYGGRIRYVHRANGGLPAARNTGIANARGEYFKFLDADDHLHPEQIAWQVEAMAGRADRVSLTAVRLYRDGAPHEYIDRASPARSLLPDLFTETQWVGIHGYLFPAGLTRAVGGFNESLRFAEDWDFFCRIGLHDPHLVHDGRVGAYYRLRPGSMSTNRAGMAATRGRLLIGLHDTLRERGRPDWFGLDLLKAEQFTYYLLVLLRVQEPELLDGLLRRIGELQGRVGFGMFGWRFRWMARALGYARAERLRTAVVRLLGRKPPPTVDTGAWRQQPASPEALQSGPAAAALVPSLRKEKQSCR